MSGKKRRAHGAPLTDYPAEATGVNSVFAKEEKIKPRQPGE